MPEHPTRPRRRRAALAAAALAVAGLVVGSLALVARDGPGQAPRSAVVSPAVQTTAPGDEALVLVLVPAGVDQARVAPTGSACQLGMGRAVPVRTARELQRALDKAARGQRIQLADGVYQGEFVLRRSGTASQRIALCGTRRAVLRGDTLKEGYVLHLDGADHWTLSGFTVTNGEKGVMAEIQRELGQSLGE